MSEMKLHTDGVPALPDTDAVGMAQMVRGGKITARELVELAIARIEALNPSVNAVVATRFERARAEVDEGLPDGPLTGVPVLIKDLNMPVEGLPSTHGSRLFADHVATQDAELVKRYKRAGMVVLGTTNSPEFGLNASTEPALHGPTRNPRRLDHSPGGSSGGSAAAVAAGMVPVAHASDGGGSIRLPASMNGLFGLKPSRGRVSTAPLPATLAAPSSVHHAVTTSVRDSALLLDISSARVPGSIIGVPAPAEPFAETATAPPGALRIGWATTFEEVATDPQVLAVLASMVELLRSLGHTVVEIEAPYDQSLRSVMNAPLMGVAFAAQVQDRLASLGRELADDDLEPLSRVLLNAYSQLSGVELVRSLQVAQRVGWEIGRLFSDLDVLLMPCAAHCVPPLGLLDTQDPDSLFQHGLVYGAWTAVFNATGMPAMSVPHGIDASGLPIGVQFAADLGQEGLLLALAGQIEREAPWQRRL